jgi:hypothetical protein
LAEAVTVLRTALQKHPQSVIVMNNLAQALSDQGRNAEATGGVTVTDSRRAFTAEAGSLRYANALQQGSLRDGVRLVTVGPYGLPVTVTGQEGGYEGLSRSAWVDGGVTVSRTGLSVTARRADLREDEGLVDLSGDVDVRLQNSRALAQEARLRREGRSLELSGSVRARFAPEELRRAAERPWSTGAGSGTTASAGTTPAREEP